MPEMKVKNICYINLQAYVKFRPYLFEMLDQLNPHFELILYTSGERFYANAVMNCIESYQ